MGDVDYGYGDDANAYGYGDDANQDYGYGDDNQDYGYGNDNQDYGYGDDNQDYGYGDDNQDYGYGDAAPDEDYGYGDEAPAPAPAPAAEKPRPKRRCSVTRFSIEAEACDKPLDYNWTGDQPPVEPQETVPEGEEEPEQAAADEKSSALTASTVDTNDQEESMIDKIPVDKLKMPKKGMMSRIRKRLSIM